jgi:hypothetical protein
VTELDGERLGRLLQKVEQLERDVADLRNDVREITIMAHKWRGAFALVLGLGGFVGWVLSWLPKK